MKDWIAKCKNIVEDIQRRNAIIAGLLKDSPPKKNNKKKGDAAVAIEAVEAPDGDKEDEVEAVEAPDEPNGDKEDKLNVKNMKVNPYRLKNSRNSV